MSPGDAAAENQLLFGPRPPDHPDAGPAQPWASKFPRPDGMPPCSLWCRSPVPERRWRSSATRSRRPPPTRSPGHPRATGHQGKRAIRRPASPGHGLLLDHAQRRVWIDGREIQLAFQEFELLAFLAAHPAIVFTRAELVERVWHRALGQDGRPVPRDSRTVDVHVSRVRRKLGPRPASAWSPSTASATSSARGRRDETHEAAEYLVWHTGL